jgi:amino acid transporter
MSAPNPPAGPQTLKREFSFVSAFGLAFAFISPIAALYTIFFLVLSSGPSGWWSLPFVLAFQLLTALVLGELASVWPLAGGLYQWSRRLLGTTYGWFAAWFYIVTLVVLLPATTYAAAPFMAQLLGIQEPGYGTLVLLSLTMLAVATVANVSGRRALSVFVILSISAECIGSIGVGTILLLFHRENPPSVLFEGFGTGLWPFAGPFLAAVAFAGWECIGFESSGDIAEEVKDPKRAVPKALIFSLLCVASVVMYAAFAVILAIPDLPAAVAAGSPTIISETVTAQLGDSVTRPLLIVILVGFTASTAAIQTSVSRVVFALSRDRVLPGASVFGRLSRRERLPLNAIFVTTAAGAALHVVGFNAAAFTVLFGTSLLAFYISFACPVIAALIQRLRGRFPAPGPFTLGRLGFLINAVAAVWLVFEVINLGWPRLPDLPWYENWGVVLMTALFGVLGVALYVATRQRIHDAAAVSASAENETEAERDSRVIKKDG